MIGSLCDTDFYKLTMMQVVLHRHAGAWVRYAFKWRNWDEIPLKCLLKDFKITIDEQIDNLCGLRFRADELKYLSGILFSKDDFIEYLRLFQLNWNYIKTYIENDQLKIDIEGLWLNTILFEIPVLAIVSESYANANGIYHAPWEQEGRYIAVISWLGPVIFTLR